MLNGHKHALFILVRNLVDNAIRYSYADQDVKIVIKNQDDSLILEIIDYGPGLSEDSKKRVFERFYREIGNNENGSGLGLNIVQQIAKLHQANVELLNHDIGSGLIVHLTFPLAD